MAAHVRLRQIAWLLAAVVAMLVLGTIGFHQTLHESWFQSFYRGVVTVTLTGLDSVPANQGSRIISLLLVAAGLTIIGYAGAVIVEATAGGVVTGAIGERRRRRAIEQLHDHFIICGYGRVGGVSPRSSAPPTSATSRSTSTKRRSRRPGTTTC